jgi:hypothetical protein
LIERFDTRKEESVIETREKPFDEERAPATGWRENQNAISTLIADRGGDLVEEMLFLTT